MSKTRNNHYVPQWHQEGFFEKGRDTLAYLDLNPTQQTLRDGRIVTHRALFDSPTSRAFCQLDLYSTFFGTSINDEIERKLFGDIDARGSKAIRAFTGADVVEWHRHFQTLFEYIDIQKIRTPKGLDWLRAQYPTLTQNELMLEMQGIRMLHCTIWSEGVREIVSAEDSDVKFIISDHPVTIYNHALPPALPACSYPHDPSIASKASQTIFPLNRNFCLIFTNLEYARDPSTAPTEKRTFARNFRQSMARTDAFVRSRKLSSMEVSRINYVLKARAKRYIAAGRKEWLYPEDSIKDSWSALRETFLPQKDELWHFGGEMFAKFDSGRVHYQDEFGRTEKERDFLKKTPSDNLRPNEACGCGYGKSFIDCCMHKPAALRPIWTERSIRERNLMFQRAIANVLELKTNKDWAQVRRELTDEKISTIYNLYEGLWPLETDLLALLPKPDGMARAVYTGSIHPNAIQDFALGASLYFGDLIIQHPFQHPGIMKEEYSPVHNPKAYRQEFLKSVVFFFTVMPLVDLGIVNLIPDPCDFDTHLRKQTFDMAKDRSAGVNIDLRKEPRLEKLMKEDVQRGILSFPREVLRSVFANAPVEKGNVSMDDLLNYIDRLKESDPLAVLQEDALSEGEKNGQLTAAKLAPNFEIAMYLAQATGSSIVTDNQFRWEEMIRALSRRAQRPYPGFVTLARDIKQSEFLFPQDVSHTATLASENIFEAYNSLMRELFKYLAKIGERKAKPNREANLTSRFSKIHPSIQTAIRKTRIPVKAARISSLFPTGGIQDNTINRLLLMSSSEHHLSSVPMAFLIEAAKPQKPS